MMRVDVKQLNRDGKIVDVTRAWNESDKQIGLSRRAQALLAAAGECEPVRLWYVLRVADRLEKAVDNALEKAGVERWLPVCAIQPKRRGKRKWQAMEPVSVPVWPGYLFVRVANTAHSWAGLATVDGVLSVLGTAERPAPINETKLLKLKMSLEKDEKARDVLADAMQVGQSVRVEDGPFASFEGVVTWLGGFDRAQVEVNLFGRLVPVDLELAQLAKIG